MKKLFLLLITITIVHADAQRRMSFGVKGGLNIADFVVAGENDLVHFSRMSFNSGAFVQFYLKERISVQPELLFSAQGTEAQVDHGNDVFPRYENNNWVFNYVNFPLMLQYLVKNAVSLETGPQIGKLVSAKVKSGHELPFDLRDYSKAFDLSWNFGAAYVSKLGLGVGFRYSMGLNNINKSNDFIYKNRVWQLDLVYSIRR